MAFSFNPTVQSSGEGQGAPYAPPVSGAAPLPSQEISLSDVPTAPESPILFLSQRGRSDITVMAYAQMLLILITILMVISSITLAVYGFYLKRSILSNTKIIEDAESSFVDLPITEMEKTSKRHRILSQLLKEYVSMRSPLKLLESVVEDKAYFDKFLLSRQTKTGGYSASFFVITKDYQSLIQQLEALKLKEYAKVAPQPKIDKFKQDGEDNLTIEVTTPVMVQGLLPDDVVFLTSNEEVSREENNKIKTEDGSLNNIIP